jgi:hypothetical protein
MGARNSICSKRASSAQADRKMHQICVRAIVERSRRDFSRQEPSALRVVERASLREKLRGNVV